MGPAPLFSEPGSPLPSVERPFAVLLDADDDEWGAAEQLRSVAMSLLEAGCRYFVCFGERSEEVHDRIDDCVVEKSVLLGQGDYEGIITTYHADESVADVAEFFVNCALPDMRGALALIRDKQKWAAALGSVINDR
jgi:hypothetical protein